MKALVIGATGATGKDLVNVLLNDSAYTEVVTFVRHSGGVEHPKLVEVLTNFDKLEDVSPHIKGDVLFSCLGTTLKKAGSKENQRHIDYEIPLNFAEIAKGNGVGKVVLVSAYGASSKSGLFYNKIKGQLEDGIVNLAFDQFVVFRPGMLQREDTDRPGERIGLGVLKIVNSLGLFKKYRPLPTSLLAEKLSKAPKVLQAGKYVIELEKIFEF